MYAGQKGDGYLKSKTLKVNIYPEIASIRFTDQPDAPFIRKMSYQYAWETPDAEGAPIRNASGRTVGSVIFTSSNEKVATVDANGVLKGIKNGTTYIRWYFSNAGASIEFPIQVTVSAAPSSVWFTDGEGTPITSMDLVPGTSKELHFASDAPAGYSCTSSSKPVTGVSGTTYFIDEGTIDTVIVPEGVMYIGYGTFGPTLKNVTLPASVTFIDDGAFDYESSENVKITAPEGSYAAIFAETMADEWRQRREEEEYDV